MRCLSGSRLLIHLSSHQLLFLVAKDLANKLIYVAGHRGMVGSAIIRHLRALGFADPLTRTRDELDLRNQAATREFYTSAKPDIVIFAAARVGGIHANSSYPADFIYDNLAMAVNSIRAAYENGCKRFLFLGSTCIYPANAPQPLLESSLLSSPLEKTNEAYAIAKIAGLKMCEHYRAQYGILYHSAMPSNLYGPGDNYHPENSHVMPALIRRLHEAKLENAKDVAIWGSGKPRREFLHVDDLAKAVIHLIGLEDPPNLVNVGTGKDLSIHELATLVAEIVGYKGELRFDVSKPDGTMVKRTDTTLINQTGWTPKIALREGIRRTYASFLEELQADQIRIR